MSLPGCPGVHQMVLIIGFRISYNLLINNFVFFALTTKFSLANRNSFSVPFSYRYRNDLLCFVVFCCSVEIDLTILSFKKA